MDRQGSLTLNNPVAGGAQQGTLVTPIDQALSPDGQFLYQLSPGNGMVVPFAISPGSGGPTQLTPVSDGLGAGQSPQGIAAVDFNQRRVSPPRGTGEGPGVIPAPQGHAHRLVC